ncbi:hypothetical protein AB0J80_22005 [Actinoplanes sp. NPDC049548]|uniref:hypothetical protein n=1 Tax=Actinoplanes sp. NPDC049548 TaxID=3155152 RepID=UPI003447077C
MPARVAPRTALHDVYALASRRGMHPHRPDGLINLFTNPDADLRTVDDPQRALDAMATGAEHGQLWTGDEVDIFLNLEDGHLMWALDATFCHRRPTPEAEAFRELHRRLTGLWLDVAQRLDAEQGRVLDEWSMEQVWDLGIHDAEHPVGGWPAELGWWTYLGTGLDLPASPAADVTAGARRLGNGALLVNLLDDPAAVDPVRYADLHVRWLAAPRRPGT